VALKTTHTASSKLLSKHPESPSFNSHFHYRSVIGKLNYLEKSICPDIVYAIHQCARLVLTLDASMAKPLSGWVDTFMALEIKV
jgi:hypothetical protein